MIHILYIIILFNLFEKFFYIFGFFIVAGLFTIFNPLFWIIFLIVLLVRRGGQQQQQQVVVITGGQSNGAPRLRCPKCQQLSPGTAKFCGGCGVRFG